MLLQKDIDKYSISKNKKSTINKIIITTTHIKPDSDCNGNEKNIAVKNDWSEKV